MTTLSDHLKTANITVPEAAKALEISEVHVRRLMNFERYPSPKLGQRIIDWSKDKITYEGLYRVRKRKTK